jgi:hypothetical protein
LPATITLLVVAGQLIGRSTSSRAERGLRRRRQTARYECAGAELGTQRRFDIVSVRKLDELNPRR